MPIEIIVTALVRQKTEPDFDIIVSIGDTRLTHDGEGLPNTDSGVEAGFP